MSRTLFVVLQLQRRWSRVRKGKPLAGNAEYAAIRDRNVMKSDGTQFLSNIASLVIKQMNPTTHGKWLVRYWLFKLNCTHIEKQRKSFEEKLNALTNAYLNETFEKECVENITMAFKVCFDVNCPREYRIRCLRKLTLLAGSASNTGNGRKLGEQDWEESIGGKAL